MLPSLVTVRLSAGWVMTTVGAGTFTLTVTLRVRSLPSWSAAVTTKVFGPVCRVRGAVVQEDPVTVTAAAPATWPDTDMVMPPVESRTVPARVTEVEVDARG